MSRSGYTDDCDGWELIRWRGAVASAIRGKRGQAFLQELLAALDAMPQKRLIRDELEEGGEVCALGAVGRARGVDMANLDPYEHDRLAKVFGISSKLVQEIEFMNDECGPTPEARWRAMRAWVVENIKASEGGGTGRDQAGE